MNVKQLWPKILVLVLSGLSILSTFLYMLLVEQTDFIPALLTTLVSILTVGIYYIPTFLYSSPKVFLINWLGGSCCCIGWFVALYFAIKDKAIPTMPVGVPTDYSQNQVNNYWGNDGQAQNQWGNTNNQQPAQTQWDNTQPTQNQWDANQQPTQNSGNDYWNQNGNSQGF